MPCLGRFIGLQEDRPVHCGDGFQRAADSKRHSSAACGVVVEAVLKILCRAPKEEMVWIIGQVQHPGLGHKRARAENGGDRKGNAPETR